MSEGTKVVSGRRWQGRYVRWHTQNTVCICERGPRPGCGRLGSASRMRMERAFLQEVSENGEKRRVCASLSSGKACIRPWMVARQVTGSRRSVPTPGRAHEPLSGEHRIRHGCRGSTRFRMSSAGEEAAADETAETDDAPKPPTCAGASQGRSCRPEFEMESCG